MLLSRNVNMGFSLSTLNPLQYIDSAVTALGNTGANALDAVGHVAGAYGGAVSSIVGGLAPGVSQAFGVVGGGVQALRPTGAPLQADASSASNVAIYAGAAAAGLIVLMLLLKKKRLPAPPAGASP